MNFKKIKKAFTLVELIIVITILSILATISFVSFQGYTKNSRDTNRSTTLTNIQKGLDVYFVQVGSLPEPDGTILSGSINGVQLQRVGIVGNNIAGLIKLSKTPADVLSANNFIYGISADKKQYQVGATTEKGEISSLLHTLYADNGNYRAKVVGNYKYPLKYNGKIYTLPSLLFTGTGGDLTQSGNAYFIIDKGTNIPYTLDRSSLNNTQNISQVLQNITGTGNLTLTGVTLPTESSEQFKNLSSTSSTIQNLQQVLGVNDMQELGNIIYGNSYDTNTSIQAPITYINCDAGSQNGYTYSSIIHNQSTSVTKTQSVPNGNNVYGAQATCNNGTVSITNEQNNINCNSNYVLQGGSCVQDICGGTVPTNGNSTATNQTVSQNWTYNTTPGTCTFVCNSGYTYDNTSKQCIANSCTTPTSAVYSGLTYSLTSQALTHGNSVTITSAAKSFGSSPSNGSTSANFTFSCTAGSITTTSTTSNSGTCSTAGYGFNNNYSSPACEVSNWTFPRVDLDGYYNQAYTYTFSPSVVSSGNFTYNFELIGNSDGSGCSRGITAVTIYNASNTVLASQSNLRPSGCTSGDPYSMSFTGIPTRIVIQSSFGGIEGGQWHGWVFTQNNSVIKN